MKELAPAPAPPSLPSSRGGKGPSSPHSPGWGRGEDAASSDLEQRHTEGEFLGSPPTWGLQADPRDQLPWIYSQLLKSQLLPGAAGLGKVGSFGTAATPIPAQRQPGEHPREAAALPGSSWGAEDAPSHSGDEGFPGCSEGGTGTGMSTMALTSWPTVPTGAGSSLPAFAEVVDQDQHPQGDEEVCSDDPCHGQGVQLLAGGTHCRGGGQGDAQSQGSLTRGLAQGYTQLGRGKGQTEGEGESPSAKNGLWDLSLPTQSGNGLGSAAFTQPSAGKAA